MSRGWGSSESFLRCSHTGFNSKQVFLLADVRELNWIFPLRTMNFYSEVRKLALQ